VLPKSKKVVLKFDNGHPKPWKEDCVCCGRHWVRRFFAC